VFYGLKGHKLLKGSKCVKSIKRIKKLLPVDDEEDFLIFELIHTNVPKIGLDIMFPPHVQQRNRTVLWLQKSLNLALTALHLNKSSQACLGAILGLLLLTPIYMKSCRYEEIMWMC
jgi:hypothetical protein